MGVPRTHKHMRARAHTHTHTPEGERSGPGLSSAILKRKKAGLSKTRCDEHRIAQTGIRMYAVQCSAVRAHPLDLSQSKSLTHSLTWALGHKHMGTHMGTHAGTYTDRRSSRGVKAPSAGAGMQDEMIRKANSMRWDCLCLSVFRLLRLSVCPLAPKHTHTQSHTHTHTHTHTQASHGPIVPCRCVHSHLHFYAYPHLHTCVCGW